MVRRLGVGAVLRRKLASTNPIESCLSTLEQGTVHIFWLRASWYASAEIVGKSLRSKSVTYVFGTSCNPCPRAGHFEGWRARRDSNPRPSA